MNHIRARLGSQRVNQIGFCSSGVSGRPWSDNDSAVECKGGNWGIGPSHKVSPQGARPKPTGALPVTHARQPRMRCSRERRRRCLPIIGTKSSTPFSRNPRAHAGRPVKGLVRKGDANQGAGTSARGLSSSRAGGPMPSLRAEPKDDDLGDSKQLNLHSTTEDLMTTRITIQTTSIGQRGQHYRVTDAGRVLLESTREPLFDACRALAAKGITGRLEMWRPSKTYPDMTADIIKGAGLTVAETAEIGPIIRDWKPFARKDTEHAFAAAPSAHGEASPDLAMGGAKKHFYQSSKPPSAGARQSIKQELEAQSNRLQFAAKTAISVLTLRHRCTPANRTSDPWSTLRRTGRIGLREFRCRARPRRPVQADAGALPMSALAWG